MSTDKASWNQAGHFLRVFSDQKLNVRQTELLNAGYFVALAKGAKGNSLPPLDKFSEFCGAETPLLVFDDEHIARLDLSKHHNPGTFWHSTKEAPARYIGDILVTFCEEVVALAEPISLSGCVVEVPYADTKDDMTRNELNLVSAVGNYKPSVVCAVMAAMMEKQPNGEAGYLLNTDDDNDCTNCFVCGSRFITVDWCKFELHWRIFSWHPNYSINKGSRVFSGKLKLS